MKIHSWSFHYWFLTIFAFYYYLPFSLYLLMYKFSDVIANIFRIVPCYLSTSMFLLVIHEYMVIMLGLCSAIGLALLWGLWVTVERWLTFSFRLYFFYCVRRSLVWRPIACLSSSCKLAWIFTFRVGAAPPTHFIMNCNKEYSWNSRLISK